MPSNFLSARDTVWLSCPQLWSLTSLAKQSARTGSQRTSEVSGPGRDRCEAKAGLSLPCTSSRLQTCGIYPTHHSKALTQKLLNPDVSVLLNCKLHKCQLHCLQARSFSVSLHQLFSLSVTVWCSWSIDLITGANWVIYSTTSVCAAEYRKYCTKGWGCCVSLLTFQGHIKTSEKTESRSSSKHLRVSPGAAETYIYIRNTIQINQSSCISWVVIFANMRITRAN